MKKEKYFINSTMCTNCNHGNNLLIGHYENDEESGVYVRCNLCNDHYQTFPYTSVKKESDPVNNPSHYTRGNIETIDYIEDKNLNFNLGNAVKYISRAGHKDKDKIKQDLEKAVWYINREIGKLDA